MKAYLWPQNDPELDTTIWSDDLIFWPSTTTFGEVPQWHLEDGKKWTFCGLCEDHHLEQIRVEDPPIPFAATFHAVMEGTFERVLVDFERPGEFYSAWDSELEPGPITATGGDIIVPLPDWLREYL